MHHPDIPQAPSPPPRFWRRPAGLAWLTAILVAGFFLLREHWGHVLGLWPYLLLAACPLMHLLHGHGHGHGRHRPTDSKLDESNGQ